MIRPQKVKIFASSNVVGLEKELNNWLRNTTPHPIITEIETTGWGAGGGAGGGAGEYTVICVVIYEQPVG